MLPLVFFVVLGVQWPARVDPHVLFLDTIEEPVLTFVQDGVVLVVS